jgi:hypothetical protein
MRHARLWRLAAFRKRLTLSLGEAPSPGGLPEDTYERGLRQQSWHRRRHVRARHHRQSLQNSPVDRSNDGRPKPRRDVAALKRAIKGSDAVVSRIA